MSLLRRLMGLLGTLNDQLKRTTHLYMVLVAVAVGVLAGYGAVGFRFLIHYFQDLAWDTKAFSLDHVASLPWYWVVAVPAAGGVLVNFIVGRFAPEAKGHGVPEVMEAVALQGGRIRPRVVAAKALASGICIASGGSVGREGPIVQIGAAIGSTAGQALQVRARRLRTLVGCGAAAGIAATFNAPVAGALFGVEILLGDFGVPQFSPIVISSVVATVVSRHYLGDLPAFEIPSYSLEHPFELAAYAVLGVLACFVAIGFIRMLYGAEDLFDRLPVPGPVKGLLGGACVGALALAFPGILGVGYEQINVALMDRPGGWLLLALLMAKLLAVSLTIGSGGSGGIFAPSLFLGAMLGGALGYLVDYGFPGQAAAPGAYALVGMGAVVAAATQAPITAIIIIFELTNDYRIILPLMIACIIATLMITRLHPESIYTLKLSRRGVRIRQGQDVNLLRGVPVREVLRPEVPQVGPDTPLLALIEQLTHAGHPALYVVGPGRSYLGAISMNELRPVISEIDVLKDLLVARDLADPGGPAASLEDTLDKVIARLDRGYRDELPVLDDGCFLGAVRMSDILNRYRTEVFRHQMAEGVAASMQVQTNQPALAQVGGYAVAEVEAPAAFTGRTLAELNVRNRFGLTVLLVKADPMEAEEEPSMPGPDYHVGPGDRLVVFGPAARIEDFRRA